MSMKNKMYGIVSVRAINSNWNADFDGNLKTNALGQIYGSDVALKYAYRNEMDARGLSVLLRKSYIEDGGSKKSKKAANDTKVYRPRSLEERFLHLVPSGADDKPTAITELFKLADVKQFGVLFATKLNLHITGAVQFSQGLNVFPGARTEVQDTLSPFINSSNEDATQSTIGETKFCAEAHYIYPFTITPAQYREYEELGYTEGYTEEDYQTFKDITLVAATNSNSRTKHGCSTEFALFIKGDEFLTLSCVDQFITLSKDEKGYDVYTLQHEDILNELGDRIEEIEIYYNPMHTKVVGTFPKCKYYNLITKREIK